MKNAVKTAFLLCSSLIGAGFATGREVCEYFPPNGIFGILSAIFSCALMSVFIYIITRHGGKIAENTAFRAFVFLFSVCTTSAMFAGAGEFRFGRGFMAAAVTLTYFFGFSGVESAGTVLTPVMAAYIILSAFICGEPTLPQKTSLTSHPFIYAGFNILSFPILLKNTRTERPFLSSALVFALMAPLITAVCIISKDYADFEMPVFAAVGGGFACKIILFAAMYTTAACSAFCMADIAGKNYGYFGIFLAFCTSFFGFGKIVSSGYRVFGIIGFSVCLALAAESFKSKTKNFNENKRKQKHIKENKDQYISNST